MRNGETRSKCAHTHTPCHLSLTSLCRIYTYMHEYEVDFFLSRLTLPPRTHPLVCYFPPLCVCLFFFFFFFIHYIKI